MVGVNEAGNLQASKIGIPSQCVAERDKYGDLIYESDFVSIDFKDKFGYGKNHYLVK